VLVNGVLTVTPATLTVTADTKYINRGDPLPTFTSTITGFVGNDRNTIISGPTHTLSPVYTGLAGVYTIIPSNLVLSSSNYLITYVNGTFYVNPKGQGAKKIKPSLICIDTLVNHPSGFNYVARFAYQNDNSTAVYIPLGPDNRITALGSFSGTPPVVFVPGGGQFEIYFDGLKLTWTVRSFEVNQKASVASEASSTSNKCNSGNARLSSDVQDINNPQELVVVYPNPFRERLVIQSDAFAISPDQIQVYDLMGKLYAIPFSTQLSDGVELDLRELSAGHYILRLNSAERQEMFHIIKE
jgi:hypothetical protein